MPEGTSFDQTGKVLSGVTDSVIERLEQQAAAAPPEPTPAPQAPQSEPEQRQEPESQSEPQAPEPQPGPYWEGDHRGKRYTFSKEEADYLMRFGIDAFESSPAVPPQGTPAETPREAPQPPPDELADIPQESRALLERFFNSQTKELRQELEDLKAFKRQAEEDAAMRQRQEQLGRSLTELQQVLSKNDFYKQYEGNERAQALIRSQTALRRGQNPNLSFEGAVKLAIEDIKKTIDHQKSEEYIKGKIDQARHKVEGTGGSAPAPGRKKLGRKDWHGGDDSPVLQAALQRAEAAAAER